MLKKLAFICSLSAISCIEAVSCQGYSDFGASYQWFSVPEVNPIIRGAGGEIATASPRGGIDPDESGWGVMAALGFRWASCAMGEFRGFYTQTDEDSKSSTALVSNNMVFYNINGSGASYSATADKGISAFDLRLYGGDALLICDLFCSDCNQLSWAVGLSYKRLEQEHNFYGSFQGNKVGNFFVKDELNTDYAGAAFGLRGQTFFTQCMAFFILGEVDLYYTRDCLSVNQTVNPATELELELDNDDFSVYAEGKMGMMFINGCFTLGVHGFYGYFSYAPQVVYPLASDAGAVYLDSDELSRYGAELTFGMRF